MINSEGLLCLPECWWLGLRAHGQEDPERDGGQGGSHGPRGRSKTEGAQEGKSAGDGEMGAGGGGGGGGSGEVGLLISRA